MTDRTADPPFDDEEPPLTGPLAAFYGWAAAGKGAPLLFTASLLEALGLPLPPDFLLGGLVVGAPWRTKRLVGVCLLGSVLGGAITYFAAPLLWERHRGAIEARFGFAGYSNEGLRLVHGDFVHHGWWSALFAGLLPVSFHRQAFTAGVFRAEQAFVPFLFATVVAHAFRYLIGAGLAAFFADALKPMTARRPGASVLVVLFLAALLVARGLAP